MKNHYRFILFFTLGWIMFRIIGCTSAPIQSHSIKHGVVDYHELIEPLGTKHLYRSKPIVDKTLYCLIHNSAETIWLDNEIEKVRRYTGPQWR